MVALIRHDLEFILRQIKIAEAHSAGTPLTEIRVDLDGNVTTDPNAAPAIPAPLSPYGLRTVDGSYNNLVAGREEWGAADTQFVRITAPVYRNEADDSITFGAGSPGQVTLTDGNYGAMGAPPPASHGLGGGTVVDADPRIISNLIVDQTLENPAAIYAALTYAGIAGAELSAALTEIRSAYTATKTATPEAKPAAQANLDAILAEHGIEMEGTTVVLKNVAPDEGLSASYNGWFTLFGQFFDHGLDLVNKANNGTVYIPLQQDDPLFNKGADGIAGTVDDGPNFMALTRTTTDAVNLTTAWVDQNQTYTSHSSHQLFLREYELVDGKPLATGKLLQGERGLATWADVKAQAAEMLGIKLTDADISNIPLFKMDEYGEFVRGVNGLPLLVMSLGADGKFGGGDDVFLEGNLTSPISTAGALRTGHAFLDDIAHAAVPVVTGGVLMQDYDTTVGYTGGFNSRGQQTAYDNELLDAHYITGDGRGNENIGLSAVHHIFHSEHNHTVEQVKARAIETGDVAFLNEWLREDVAEIPADLSTLQWDGERLFQAARFTTEMQYQHLVFEEFARKVQPDIDVFVFNPSTDINPNILAEFAHVVYRFGHSMLRETVDQINPDGTRSDMDLFDAFLNPLAFGSAAIDHEAAAGAIVRGMTSQVGSEIDEFVTDVLRNQLVGIPLDLAALNIARGRDTGIPSLNEARRQFKEAASGDTQLDPYTSWTDFMLNLKNPASIVNFIAAYGTHDSITSAATVAGKRDAAMALVLGGEGAPADRDSFLNGTGDYAADLGGLENIDLWVGGMAEKKMAFGGMLGSTFSFIFELQMENLQNGDRFYYLSRVQGLNLLNELENNSLAKMVLNNTDLGETGYALPGDIFSVPDHVLYLDKNQQERFGYADPTQEDPFLQAVSPMVKRIDANNDGVAEYIRVNTNDHLLIQGTNDADTIISGGGDDAVWGRGGNDVIEAGYGVDKIHGGDGDDIITNNGTDIGETDMLHGEAGNDVIHGGSGLALIFGNEGQDFIITGPDGKEAFGGTGNDFILGGQGGDFLLGNEGDDWIEAGDGFDTSAGDNSELNFNSSIIGHDVMFAGQNEHDFDAESGDDIMVQGESVMRNEGMFGFDWAIHKGNQEAADSDLTRPIFTTDEQDILRDRFDQVEALSGWDKNDILRGDNRGAADGAAPPVAGDDGVTLARNELTHAGVDRIAGLRELLGDLIGPRPTSGNLEAIVAFDDGNILLGGGGSDIIEGRGGNDVIDGDAWLNVRIKVSLAGGAIGSAEGMTSKVTDAAGNPLFGGKALFTLMLDGTLNPAQLSIVREIITPADVEGQFDTAQFSGPRADYDITREEDGSVTVAHLRGTATDGTDRLLNIERLEFSDQTVRLNRAASGTVQLSDTTPTEGLMLTASPGTFLDLDGVLPGTAFQYQWQVFANNAWSDIAGATSASFVPGSAQVNRPVRVVMSFTDSQGFAEQLASAPTTVVGDFFLGGINGDSPTLTAGDDRAFGSDGNDTLSGLASNDTLDGGAGNDRLDGGTGADQMRGGAGQDTYVVDNAGDVVDETGGSGTDTVESSITYTLGAGVEWLTLTGVAAIDGTGNGLDNRATGNAAANALSGGAGADRLIGGDGNDTLTGGDGIDTLSGGLGNDVYNAGAGDSLSEAGGDGHDVVITGVSWTLGNGFEDLVLTGNGAVTGNGNNAANAITGNAGANTLVGFAGADTLLGGEGNDTMTGGADADYMEGGNGNDVYNVYDTADTLVEAFGAGTDWVRSSVSFTLGANFENLTLLDTAANATGNGQVNTIRGNAVANTLRGEAGNNSLFGGDGADTLSGGEGADAMTGGAGADVFLFDVAPVADAADRVADFVSGVDAVHLSLAAFDPTGLLGLVSGSLAGQAGHFGQNLTGLASGPDAAFTYESDAGRLWWDADGAGAGDRVLVSAFTGAPAMTASDFIMV